MFNPESNLRSEYGNARIVDYRDPQNPNNNILITCEHAFNDLPEGYSWTEHDETYFANEHWACDIGAYNMAHSLARELKCVFVHTLYSRLLIDTNRSIVADTLIRKRGDGRDIDLNKDLTYEEEQKRINAYYVPFYEALREISVKVNPKQIISVHSFTPVYEGEARSLEVGVMHGYESVELGVKINEAINQKGYLSENNKPYNGLILTGAIHSILTDDEGCERECITFEFRNDILTNERRFPQLMRATAEAIKNECELSHLLADKHIYDDSLPESLAEAPIQPPSLLYL